MATRDPALALFRVVGALGFGRGLGLLKAIVGALKEPLASLATTRFYQPAPIQLGPYAARLSLIQSRRTRRWRRGRRRISARSS